MKTSARRTTLAAFTAALLLTSSMTPVSAQIPSSASPAAEYNAFFNSKYKACDADILSQLWQVDKLGDAKIRIGGMLLAHQENEIEAALKDAKAKRLRCMSGFHFIDAWRVAALWATPAGD
jgi:hypothetical protein